MQKFLLAIFAAIIFISCSQSEPRRPVSRKTGTFLKESIDRNKELNQKEEQLLKLKMERDTLHNYIDSGFGFWYYYNQKDTVSNVYPKKGDEVIINYEIKNIADQIIYSKEEIGEVNYLVEKQEQILGLQEGIKLIKEGEVITFLFPSHKALGYTGNERIKSNEPLIYTVNLKKIITNNNTNENN